MLLLRSPTSGNLLLPPALLKRDNAIISAVTHTPFGSLGTSLPYQSNLFGNVSLTSIKAFLLASRLRFATKTLKAWEKWYHMMEHFSESFGSMDHLAGIWWPRFWSYPAFAVQMMEACKLYPQTPTTHDALER